MRDNITMKQPDIDDKSSEACILDVIEQFVCEKRKLLQDRGDLERQIKDRLKTHGRSWKPLYELFEPLGLLPIDAKCNDEKRDVLYALSKTAIGRIGLYLQVMKRLAEASKKKPAESVVFAKSDYHELDCWNQLRNFLENMQKAHVVSICVKDNGETLSICPKADQLRFFDGGWAENGMVYLIEKTIKSFSKANRLTSSIFWNVKLSNGAPWDSIKYEFDAIAKVGEMFYVFEVKTGAILPVDKWFERWSLFKNVGVRYIQCTAKEIDYRLFMPLQLFPIANFEQLLQERLKKDLVKSKDDKDTCGDIHGT